MNTGEVVETDLMTIGADNVSAFAGNNGGTANALGLELSNVNFALAMLTDATRKWTSLQAEVGSVALLASQV